MVRGPAGGLHRLDRRARPQKHPVEIDPHQRAPVVQCGVQKRAAAGDAGIVHEHVEVAELLDRRIDDRCPIFFHGDVKLERSGTPSALSNFRGNGLGFGVGDIGQNHTGAFARERSGTAGADSRRSAGNDRDLAGNTIGHRSPPPGQSSVYTAFRISLRSSGLLQQGPRHGL